MKVCPRCGRYHMKSPIPTSCTGCGATLWAVATPIPDGYEVIDAAVGDPDHEAYNKPIPGSVRTKPRPVE